MLERFLSHTHVEVERFCFPGNCLCMSSFVCGILLILKTITSIFRLSQVTRLLAPLTSCPRGVPQLCKIQHHAQLVNAIYSLNAIGDKYIQAASHTRRIMGQAFSSRASVLHARWALSSYFSVNTDLSSPRMFALSSMSFSYLYFLHLSRLLNFILISFFMQISPSPIYQPHRLLN